MSEPRDWLSRLLEIVPISGRLDIRCSYGAPWKVLYPRSALGEMPYHVILAGKGILESPDGTRCRELVPGDVVLLPHGSEHTLHDGSGRRPAATRSRHSMNIVVSENRGKGEHFDMLCGRFLLSPHHDRLIRSYLPTTMAVRTSGMDPASSKDQAPSQLKTLVALMRAESMSEELGSSAILNGLSAAFFALILRTASVTGTTPTGLLALAGEPRLAAALNAMFNEPHRNWRLEELADLCNMSRTTIIRLFKVKVGRSASELLMDIRMTIAGDALRNTSSSTDQIAEEVGYLSLAAFRRAFTRHTGSTPGEWRRSPAAKAAT